MRERTGRILDKSVVVAGGIALLANQTKTPQSWSDFLGRNSWVIYVLLIIVGFVGSATPVEAWAARGRSAAKLTVQRRVLVGLGNFIDLAQRNVVPAPSLDDVGLHSWRVKRTIRHPVTGILKRTGTFRVGGTVMTVANFNPPKGKGVVGLCWKHNSERQFNVTDLAARLQSEAAFDQWRLQHGGDSVMNLSWEEFDRVRHRGAVFAAPVRNGSRFVGCFSVDYAEGFDQVTAAGVVQALNTFVQGFSASDLETLG